MYIIILGCGRVGAELAKLLSGEGHNVAVVDKKDESFSRLGETFNGLTIKGNGVSTKVLQDAGVQKADIFCALTDSDNVNIMASQVAKKIFNVHRVITRTYDPRKADIYRATGLEILSETKLFASLLRDKINDEMLSGVLIETSELGVLETPLPEQFANKRIDEVNIPGEFMITAIKRSGKPVVIPDAGAILAKGDIVIAVVKIKSLKKVRKILNLGE